jgi:hypothetical protein
MKLYHFTTAGRIASIIETGLRAVPLAFGGCETIEGLKRQRGVWLTELDSLHVTTAESEFIFKKCGEWRRYWLHDKADHIARITIRIGDNDQRLTPFNCHLPELARIDQRTWLYLRTITPDKITNIDRVAPSWTEKETRAIAA